MLIKWRYECWSTEGMNINQIKVEMFMIYWRYASELIHSLNSLQRPQGSSRAHTSPNSQFANVYTRFLNLPLVYPYLNSRAPGWGGAGAHFTLIVFTLQLSAPLSEHIDQPLFDIYGHCAQIGKRIDKLNSFVATVNNREEEAFS